MSATLSDSRGSRDLLEQGGTVVGSRDVAIGHECDPTSYSMPVMMHEWYAIV